MLPSDLTAVILCGGRGTRAWPLTENLPKPLLPVSGRPALSHILEIYALQGVSRFILAAGYKHERIKAWADDSPHDATTVDTGEDGDTGERISRVLDRVGGTFFATYGDGLGNVALADLLVKHGTSNGATVTTVPLPSQYGTVDFGEGDAVVGFKEKPLLQDHWINAGYFVFDSEVFARHAGTSLEGDTLPALAAAGHLGAYRHRGFWKSMDTLKDVNEMTALAELQEGPPWLQSL